MNHSAIAMLLALLVSIPVARAQITETFNFDGINRPITDGDLNGVLDIRTISSSIASISDVNVTLSISGTFNGDLFVRLNHGDDFSVLLNRVGSRTLFPPGYGDDGFSNVKFDDEAPDIGGLAPDVHSYRLNLTGNHLIGLGAGMPLTGTWQPDARNLDPNLETGTRTDFLNAFKGTDANGGWSLYVADQSFGETHVLLKWGLEISGVPEPSTYAFISLGLAIVAWKSKRGKRRR